jgi:hypothetical protein
VGFNERPHPAHTFHRDLAGGRYARPITEMALVPSTTGPRTSIAGAPPAASGCTTKTTSTAFASSSARKPRWTDSEAPTPPPSFSRFPHSRPTRRTELPMASKNALARAGMAMAPYAKIFEGMPDILLSQALADLMVWAKTKSFDFDWALKNAREMHAECD